MKLNLTLIPFLKLTMEMELKSNMNIHSNNLGYEDGAIRCQSLSELAFSLALERFLTLSLFFLFVKSYKIKNQNRFVVDRVVIVCLACCSCRSSCW